MIMLSISVGNMSITGYHHLLAEERSLTLKSGNGSDSENIRKWRWDGSHDKFPLSWYSLNQFDAFLRVHTYITYLLCLKSEGVSCARVISERVSEVTCLIRPVWDLSPVRPWRMTRAPITDNIVISASLARPRPRHPAFQIPERASRLCSQHLKSLAFSSYLF